MIARLFRRIGGHSSRFVLICSFWRLSTIKMIKSVKVFPFSFWFFFFFYFKKRHIKLHKLYAYTVPRSCNLIRNKSHANQLRVVNKKTRQKSWRNIEKNCTNSLIDLLQMERNCCISKNVLPIFLLALIFFIFTIINLKICKHWKVSFLILSKVDQFLLCDKKRVTEKRT